MRIAIAAVLLTALTLAGGTLAADKEAPAKGGDKDAATKGADNDAAPKGDQQVKTGTVGVKSVTAAAEVVAMLYTMDKDYKLIATGDLVTRLEDLAKKKTKAEITGAIADDKITVSKVVDLEHKTEDKKQGGGKRKKKSDQQ
jgi:hypothetical protein